MIKDKIKLRILADSDNDYKLIEKWYEEVEIYTHFEQKRLTYEEVRKKYKPRTKENAKIPVYMIEYDGKPIGIIQYQLINDENKKLYGIEENNSYEIDIFIGELNYHNKGIGKICIDLLSEYLFEEKKAEILVMCPLKNNHNAIKCYQKCNFKIINEFTTKDTVGNKQEYILMTKVINELYS